MIVLDTNVISEVINPSPDNPVRLWMGTVHNRELAIAATVAAELLMGIAILPAGKRRRDLAAEIDNALAKLPVLPFDTAAARVYAEIVATRHKAGQPISTFDAQIAAVARLHNAAVATRDANGFVGCGIDVIDPWSYRQ